MRGTAWLLLIGLCSCLSLAMAGDHVVRLTATTVTSAADIELAIDRATDGGSHAGTVLLDAAEGSFQYDPTASDQTINISHSNVTLRGVNGALIANCADGIWLDPLARREIRVEGIRFHCRGGGILSRGSHERVSLHNNVIEAETAGIEASGGYGWRITDNQVTAGASALQLNQVDHAFIAHNRLAGNEIAVILNEAHRSSLVCNRLEASWQGVLLTGGTDHNKLAMNKISGVADAGLVFEGSSRGNKVQGNHIFCAPGASCTAVSGSPDIFEENQIAGNRSFAAGHPLLPYLVRP